MFPSQDIRDIPKATLKDVLLPAESSSRPICKGCIFFPPTKTSTISLFPELQAIKRIEKVFRENVFSSANTGSRKSCFLVVLLTKDIETLSLSLSLIDRFTILGRVKQRYTPRETNDLLTDNNALSFSLTRHRLFNAGSKMDNNGQIKWVREKIYVLVLR